MALPRKNRIVKRTDFDELFKQGRAVRGSFLFIRALLSQKKFSRFVFLVSSKIVPGAVDRNRTRRIFSKIAQDFIKNNPAKNLDILVVLSKKEKEEILCQELVKLLGKL